MNRYIFQKNAFPQVERLRKLLEAMGDRDKSHRKFQQRDKERIATEVFALKPQT